MAAKKKPARRRDKYAEAKRHGCGGCARWVRGTFALHPEMGECHYFPGKMSCAETHWCTQWEAK